MKAWTYSQGGDLLKSLELKDISEPETSPAYPVLVRVKAVALQPADYKILEMAPSFVAARPGVVAGDFAGVVIKSELPEYKADDEIFGSVAIRTVMKCAPLLVFGTLDTSTIKHRTGHGTLAEIVALPKDTCIAKKPAGLSFVEVAGLTVSALTAFQLLEACRNATRILINGASGGVGSYVVQIAKAQSRIITATCSSRTEKLVKEEFGVQDAIDYTKVDLPKHLAENYRDTFDAVIDTVGVDELYKASPAFVKVGGGYWNVGASAASVKHLSGQLRFVMNHISRAIWPAMLGGTRTPYKFLSVAVKPGALEPLMPLIEDGRVKTHIDQVYQFKDAHKAFEVLKGGRVNGKLIITVDDKQ